MTSVVDNTVINGLFSSHTLLTTNAYHTRNHIIEVKLPFPQLGYLPHPYYFSSSFYWSTFTNYIHCQTYLTLATLLEPSHAHLKRGLLSKKVCDNVPPSMISLPLKENSSWHKPTLLSRNFLFHNWAIPPALISFLHHIYFPQLLSSQTFGIFLRILFLTKKRCWKNRQRQVEKGLMVGV